MSARAPETPAPGLPPGARAGLKPCTAPPAPAADVQGSRSPGQAAPAPALGSPETPGVRVGGEPSRTPGNQPQAQGDAEGRARWQAALSDRNATQRRQRAQPQRSRDPYAKGTRGARKLPPPKDGA
jgi:hypothetical protein